MRTRRGQAGSPDRRSRQDSERVAPSYPLPKDTVVAWRAVQGRGPLNAGLVFDRFVADASTGRGAKTAAWKEIVEAVNQYDKSLLEACLQRWRQVVARAKGREFTLSTDWRLVTGLGKGGPLEVGFTFSRQGFPILPGSGLKGLARAWGLREVARAANVKELGKLEKALSAEGDLAQAWRQQFSEVPVPDSAQQFRAIFGTTEAAGGAIFFDGVPTRPANLKLDIMNPHFPRYYRGEGPPSDDQNPVPVNFLTVAPGSEFVFAVGWRGRWDDRARELRQQAEDWLRQGLLKLGAGAKTSAGYGYFAEEETGG